MTLSDFFPFWPEVRRGLLDLVALIPEDDLDWAPDPAMMPFAAHVLHIAETTDYWIGHLVLGRPYEDLVERDATTGVWRLTLDQVDGEVMRAELGRSYAAIEEVLGWNAGRRSELIRDPGWGTEAKGRTLHWVLHHVLDHEIHHRAYLAAYLRMRGIPPVSEAMP